jgi:alkylated DNA repair dioxygenase AlkB
LYSYDTKPYSYSNLELKPIAVTKELHEIFEIIKKELKIKFNSVLLNLYRDGQDSNGWHADNEKELGKNPIIASISLGEVRPFHFKHRSIKEEKHKINLEHGSLLLMHGEMQHYWVHHIPKTKKEINPRINLTFRNIK